MRLNLFGVGMKGISPSISAQRRVNCYVQVQQDNDRTSFSLVGCPGLTLFASTGGQPSRGMWAVNSLTSPLLFTVNGDTLYSVNNAMVQSAIGTINTSSGDVSMADDGTYLVIVDGQFGYVYDMSNPSGITVITDMNFTSSPKTVTWQDGYFIVNSGSTNQFQLSQISPTVSATTWPAEQIGFTGSGPGALQACMSANTILHLFADVNAEFWQDAGIPGLPFTVIPGAAQEFGLASAWSLCKYDNSVAGVFKNKMGEVNVSRMSGFRLQQISNTELDYIINQYSTTADAQAFGYMNGGHPMLQVSFRTEEATWEYDGFSKAWGERQATDGGRYWAEKFANFQGRRLVSDYRNGNIYTIDPSVYTDDGDMCPMEVTSKHIYSENKYLSIPQLQIDIEAGVGTVSGQGENPQIDLQVSKDGGRSFTSVGFASMGKVGQYTTRVIWRRLGRARDWVLRVRITDPVFRVITGASAEVLGGTF